MIFITYVSKNHKFYDMDNISYKMIYPALNLIWDNLIMGNSQEKVLPIKKESVLFLRSQYVEEWADKFRDIFDIPVDVCQLDSGRCVIQKQQFNKCRYEIGYFLFEGYDTGVRHPIEPLITSCVRYFKQFSISLSVIMKGGRNVMFETCRKALDNAGHTDVVILNHNFNVVGVSNVS